MYQVTPGPYSIRDTPKRFYAYTVISMLPPLKNNTTYQVIIVKVDNKPIYYFIKLLRIEVSEYRKARCEDMPYLGETRS